MDDNLFDRMVKTLAGVRPRRAALRALAASGIAAATARIAGIDAVATKKKKKKKRCRRIGQDCGGKKKCCDNAGPARCEDFPTGECKGTFSPGKRCCGKVGARCDPNFGIPEGTRGNCSCCTPLFCEDQGGGNFRCQEEPT